MITNSFRGCRLRHVRPIGEWLEERRCLTTFPIQHAVYEGASSFTFVDIADVDGDGDLDMATAHYDEGRVRWLENEGDGEYTTHELAGTYRGPHAVKAVDLDGDGASEIVVASFRDGRADFYKGVSLGGQMTFGNANGLSTELPRIRDIEPMDVDHDGDTDLVVTTGESLRWLENSFNLNGQLRFTVRNPFTALATDILDLASFHANDDGLVDLIAVTAGGSNTTRAEIAIYAGTPTGFAVPTIITTPPGNRIWSVATADTDNDGDQDIILGFDDGQIRVALNTPTGFDLQLEITSELNEPRKIVTADVDRDGYVDIIVAAFESNRVQLLENEGNNQFLSQPNPIVENIRPSDLAVADTDGDGDMDIIVASGASGSPRSRITIFENRQLGDVNNDGLFNSSDLVLIFQAGKYENANATDVTFEDGDWNGDGLFNSADFVAALTRGNYVA